MSCSCTFENTLHYSSPANGDRGVVRTGMMVPESVELFVCPFACGRHGAIGAVKQKFKDRLAYLYVDQSDIINGYDDAIIPAVEDFLAVLPKRPKVVLIFVSCLDDLIGTDHEALQEALSKKFPDIKFRSCHMNPITTGGKTPPQISIQNNMYSLLEDQGELDMGVNTLGNFVPIFKENEIHAFLKHYGYSELRHIVDYKKFDEYQNMAKSQFNIVMRPAGKQAAEQMEERMGKPFIYLPVSYRMADNKAYYEKLVQFMGKENEPAFNMTPYEEKTQAAIDRALAAVGDMPIIVDASSVVLPFSLARGLLEYGFNVIRIQAQECIKIDKEHLEWIEKNHPEVEVMQPKHHKAVLLDKRVPESIAIGVDGAYLAGSDYVVDHFADEGMFGYHGIECLMNKLEHVLEKKADLKEMIHEYGLVV